MATDVTAGVKVRWGVSIPLRDGVQLNAILYLPPDHRAPNPTIFILTPYTAQTWHEVGSYFAEHGYAFLSVDVRGRGDSEGEFRPLIQESLDGYDVVEWIAKQPYCNGKVAMWGGSYSGYDQWATARAMPPHLATIVPVAPAYVSVDFPIRNNMPRPYLVQWLTFVTGHTSQDRVFYDAPFWRQQFRRWFEAGVSYRDLDTFLGNPSATFQEWVAQPQQGPYWDRYNPSDAEYATVSIPVLTITGIYDADQAGALMHYRQHCANAPAQARDAHYLVIGPWDHAGTRTPKAEFCGLRVGPASLVDLPRLHLQWYAWTLQSGPKPEFLKKRVAYYVMGSEKWRYADTLEDVTVCSRILYLHSTQNPEDVFRSGALVAPQPDASQSHIDHYTHDPRDVSLAALESTIDPENCTEQRLIHAGIGRQLIYHTVPFEQDTEIGGFFKLTVWLSIDQPDTDVRVSIFEIGLNGGSVRLCTDSLRARYRQSLRQATLVTTTAPLRYEFSHFMFVSRRVARGCRLRLVIGPIHSIYSQKNYNSGGEVATEIVQDARTVTVRLYHDEAHPGVLSVPIGQPDADEPGAEPLR
jgi:uncharacterized protein